MIKKGFFALLGILFLSGCDGNVPRPWVSRMGNDAGVSGDGMVNTPETIPPERTFPVDSNAYSCYCRFQVPLSCLSPGCGTVGTGTYQTDDGYCDVGVRELHVCLPEALQPRVTGRLTRESEAQADCLGRVQNALREALRATYPGCGEVCNLQYGCSAVRLDNSIRSYHDARCNRPCERVALDGRLDYENSSYIPRELQVSCSPEEVHQDTELLCAWR